MDYVLGTSYRILTDLYALSSIFYIKGIVDATTVCDPFLVEEMYQRDDGYTTLQIIMEDQTWEQDPEDYILNVTQEASAQNLNHIRNYILHMSTKDMRQALCHLMDYLYRLGLRRHAMYDGGQPEKMLRCVTPNSYRYITPKGELTQNAWHDQIRQYIMQIKLIHTKQDFPPVMQKLNEFMAVVLKNKTELNEAKQLEDERRAYILSGGNIPAQRDQNI